MPQPLLKSRRQGFLPIPRPDDAGLFTPRAIELVRAKVARPQQFEPPRGRALLLRRPYAPPLGGPRVPPMTVHGRTRTPPAHWLRGRASLLPRAAILAGFDFRHIDWQVPAWGEFAAGPTTTGTGATLAQSAAAAFPDRPTASGVGLLATLVAGTGEAYLAHDMGVGADELHARILLAPRTAAGGSVALLRGSDGAGGGGGETWRLTFDAAARTSTLRLSTGATATGTLPAGLGWSCLEVLVNAGAGKGELWINGRSAGTIAGAAGVAASRSVRVGAMIKSIGLTGQVYLDELKLGNTYRGPVLVAALSDADGQAVYDAAHAGDWTADHL